MQQTKANSLPDDVVNAKFLSITEPAPNVRHEPQSYSCILARISESLKRKYSSSPTLMEFPPQPGRSTRSPALTLVGTTWPCLLGAPGPTAMTVASGNGLLVAEAGKKMPAAVFVSGLKRWTKTRSSRGTRALIDLKVA